MDQASEGDMPEITIRRAMPEDFDSVQELNHQLFLSDSPNDPYLNLEWAYQPAGVRYYRLLVNGEYGVCFIAEAQGAPVGYLAGAVTKEEDWRNVRIAELENMFVKAEFRSQGVGQKLAEAFVEWSREQGVQRVKVIAYAGNERAIKFYKKVGFSPESLQLELDLSQ